MRHNKDIGRGLVAGAQLALVAVLCLILATTQKTHAPATPQAPAKATALVAAPSVQESKAEEKISRINKAMGALSARDAALYRMIFLAQKNKDWGKADRFLMKVQDKRLVGSVMADRFERRGANEQQLISWLSVFSKQPEAKKLYKMAQDKGIKDAPKPNTKKVWSSGSDLGGSPDFRVSLKLNAHDRKNKEARKYAVRIRRHLRKKRASHAIKQLGYATQKHAFSVSYTHDVEAAIAEVYFRLGKKDEAITYANKATASNKPLALWIRGLIAWNDKDYSLARRMFSRLAKQNLTAPSNKAAAHFWAYRAEDINGNNRAARAHLKESAALTRTFYGLLATQALDLRPSQIIEKQTPAKWNNSLRKVLAADAAGWRALALIQVGETDRAVQELKRLNPLGSRKKRQAMLSLAHYVPMPALSLRLATLTKGQGIDTRAYPFLPWKPAGGFKVDRALLFALARHESLFDPKAVSSRGARGLMQIMPKTAHYVLASDKRLSAYARDKKLIDPSLNISLGQKYVQNLARMSRIKNNLVLLLASYNAGPTKTATWLKGREDMDALLFMESIPVKETRNYVAQVLPHYWAYRIRLGRPTTALKKLASGKWPIVTMKDTHSLQMARASY